jgi:hypothetical protein
MLRRRYDLRSYAERKMTEQSQDTFSAGPSHRSVELGVAGLMTVFALIVIAGSLRAGIDWAFDGPKAGFFPFYIGLLILIASGVNFYQALQPGAQRRRFAEWGQLRQVFSVVVPAFLYVVLIPWTGMYVASVLIIALFMKWFGRYSWLMTAAVSLLVPIIAFIVFERWFLVPLPKGPVEELLGVG